MSCYIRWKKLFGSSSDFVVFDNEKRPFTISRKAGHACCSVGRRLYIYGGDDDAMNSMIIYDTCIKIYVFYYS